MKIKILSIFAVSALFFGSCGEEKENTTQEDNATEETVPEENVSEETTATGDLANKGVGPISSIELSEIDDNLASKGRDLFKLNCTACHKFGKRYIGPALEGLLERRSPEWVMNMILNPDVMVVEDPIAKALLAEYNSPMSNQQLSEENARAILEFIRTRD